MYISRVPTALSLVQLEENDLGSKAVVSQCAFQKILRISVKNKAGDLPPRIRSFGELSEVENMYDVLARIQSFGSCVFWCSETGSEAGDEENVFDHEILVDENEKSMMEMAMLALWEIRAQQGLFRYDVTACSTKTIPGVFGFLAQLNEGRATKKRPTEFRVDKVVQKFDESKFNFTKALMKEVLFAFDTRAKNSTEIDPEASAGRNPDLVMINVSPIEYGHVLLLPRVLDHLPQLVDTRSMLLALQFTSAIGNPYFRLGYNSLGAYATINHLHYQGYYLMAPYPVERAPTSPLEDTAFDSDFVRMSQLVNYPVRGWVFEMIGPFDQSIQPLALTVAHVCTKLQTMNIPHNFLICDCGARVFLWPQCYAEKQATGVVPEELLVTGVNPAAFEIAGHVILKRREDYDEITQKLICRLLSEVTLTEERFAELTSTL